MTAVSLLAEEPALGWGVVVWLVMAVAGVVAILGAGCWLAALLVSLGDDEDDEAEVPR